jgi:hypothetical protein
MRVAGQRHAPGRARHWASRGARAAAGGVLACAGAALGASPALGATGTEPAGGAAAGEAIGATIGALVATAVVVAVIAGYRSGRLALLGRAAKISERATGLPGWAALPSAVLGAALLTAVLGMYWDVSLHIDNGRDAGPLANPAHYLILIGLYGVLLSGVLSIALTPEGACRTAVRLGEGWYAPLGAIVITACGAFALSGFPLDDVWHRLFGQDVTLWGPTHLMLIGGGSLATLGVMVLMAEGINAAGRDPEGASTGILRLRRALMVGGFLVALSTFQGEFDFGVPQFRMVLHPILIMLAAGVGLVAIRTYLGRGGALLAVLGFVVIRGFLALMVGGVFGETTPHFPLYIVEAVVVEAVFAWGAANRSPILGGMLAGAGIGTIGLAAEWAWSHIWMPIPWSTALLPEALVAGFVTAVAGGAVGAFIGSSLARPRPAAVGPQPRELHHWERRAAFVGALALMLVVALFVPMTDAGPRRATVALNDVGGGDDGGRTVAAAVRIDPPPPKDVELLNITAWQGGGRVLDPLERVAPGRYRSTEPIPVHGGWKSMLRVQSGDGLVSVPLYLPRDQAIPAPEVPARPQFARAFVLDHKNLQRERKEGVAGWLTAAAYLSVLAITLGFGALLAWVLTRLGGAEEQRPPRSQQPVHKQDPRFA